MATPAEVEIEEPAAPRYVRSWSDIVQVAIALVAVGASLYLARYAGEVIRAGEREIIRLIENIPKPIESFLVGTIQVLAFYTPLVLLLVLIALQRFRRLGMVMAAMFGAAALMRLFVAVVENVVSASVRVPIPQFDGRGFNIAAAFPSPAYIAAATAVVTVETPWISRSWRRACGVVLVVLGLGRLGAGTARDVPVDLIVAYATGWFIGCALNLAAGRPNRHPDGRDVADALERSGIIVTAVALLPDVPGYAYEAVDSTGRRILVRVRRGGDRAAAGAVRLYRYLRRREVGDEHPFWSPRRRADHEALVALKAHVDGVATPAVRAVTPVGDNRSSTLVAFDRVAGRRLAVLDNEDFTQELLGQVFDIAASLRRARIAHRNMGLRRFLLDDHGRVHVVDFENAELAADLPVLANDLTELLCAMAVRVGPARAVEAAAVSVGYPALIGVLPRLQPVALSSATRAEVAGEEGLLARLGEEIRRAAGVDAVPLAQLERVKPRTVLLVVMSGFAVYALLPQLANASDVAQEISQAQIWWVAAAVLASAVTYLGAATSLTGATPDRMPWTSLAVAQVACQFANFATPAQVGGMALNVRFMQKHGSDPPVAVAAVGLNAVTGLVVHLALFGAFAYWAGTQDAFAFEWPLATILVVAAVVVVAGLITLAIPVGRHFVRDRLLPILGRAVVGIRDISRNPLKIAFLLGGALLLSAAYIAALACSVAAFGLEVPLASVGVVFLASSAVAAAAPTPGGVGVVEATLSAGLIGIGISADVALSAVLVYRFATFWLPLAPGWVAFTGLQRHGAI